MGASNTVSDLQVQQAQVKRRLLQLHHEIETCADLAPNPHVNGLFVELVALCTSTSPHLADNLFYDPELQAVVASLRRLCSEGEHALEHCWANRLLTEQSALVGLHRFPYYNNYQRLVRMEVAALYSLHAGPTRRVVFIGSGPLALSSYLLASVYDMSVLAVDHCPDAVSVSRALAEKWGVEQRVQVICAGAESADARWFDGADAVFVAAMVGTPVASKKRVLAALAERLEPHQLVLVRSAHGLRRLLYGEVDYSELAGLKALLEVRPHHEVVNSVLIASPASQSA